MEQHKDDNVIHNMARIEALLFSAPEPITIATLARTLSLSDNDVVRVLDRYADALEADGRGLMLVKHRGTVSLGTKPEFADDIKGFVQDAIKQDLTSAALETLALVAYFAPLSRAQIDYIRGVNSTYMLRSLLMRGLIVRTTEGAGYLYEPSIDLLHYFGVTDVTKLPDFSKYQEMRDELFGVQSEDINASSAEGKSDLRSE